MTEVDKINGEEGNIHVVGVFDEFAHDQDEHNDLRKDIKMGLDSRDIMYNSVMTFYKEGEDLAVQCRMAKTAIREDVLMEVKNIFTQFNGFKDVWVSSNSASYHPEMVSKGNGGHSDNGSSNGDGDTLWG